MPDNSPSDRPAPSDSPDGPPHDDAAFSNGEELSAPGSRPADVDEGTAVIRPEIAMTPGRGFWASVGWLVIYLIVNPVIAVPVSVALSAVVRQQFPGIPTAWASMAVAPVTALVLAFLHLGRWAPRALAIRRPNLLHAVLVVLAVPPLIVISSNVSGLAQRSVQAVRGAEAPAHAIVPVPVAAGLLEKLESMYEEIGRQPFLVVLLLGCICPGVAEEVYFRGFLGRGLVGRFGFVWGVLLTSLLFGLMHLIPALVCATIIMGVILHFIYLTTRSLLAPIIVHTLNNFVVLNQWRVTQDTPLAGFFGDDGVNLPLLLAALAALAGLGVVLYRTRVRWVLPDQSDWNPGYPTAESPPANWHAVPRQRPTGRRAGRAAVGTYLLFGVACAFTVVSPPHSASACFQQGMRAYDRDDFDEAIDRHGEAIRLRPDFAWAYSGRGLAYGMKGDHAAAIRDLTEAIRLDPNVADFYANRAWAHKLGGNFDEARRDCERALQRDPNCTFAAETCAATYYERGCQAHDRNNFDEAITLFDEAIARNPRLINAYCFRGISRGKNGDPAGAIRDFTEAIRLDPSVAGFYANRAWAHNLRGDFAEARRDCDAALRCDPNFAFAETRAATCYGLGGQAYDRDNFDEAINLYGEAIRCDPRSAAAHSGRGMSRGMKGDHVGALEDINEAIRLDPRVADFHAHRAWVHSLRRDFAKAVRDAEHALELDSNCALAVDTGVSAHMQLWREAYARRDADEVIAHTTAAIRLKPDFYRAYGARAVELAIKGNHADALRDLTEAIRLHKSDVYYANRAWVHNLRRDFVAAIADSDQALAMNPTSSFALRQRAAAVGGLLRLPVFINPLLP